MSPTLEETIYLDFITSSPTTGAVVDADATPTSEVFEETNDTPILTPVVAKRAAKIGNYRVAVACTSANGFEVDKSYSVIASATVGGVSAKAKIGNFQVRAVPVDPSADIAAIRAKTDNLPSDPADASDIAASFATVNGTLATKASQASVDTLAGYVDSEVAAILAAVDTEIGAIKTQTDQLQFTGGDVKATLDGETITISASDLLAISDAILKRDWTAVSGEAAYSLLNAVRMLRNVWNTTGGTLSVKKEDGSTNAWTRTLATDPTAQPIVGAT